MAKDLSNVNPETAIVILALNKRWRIPDSTELIGMVLKLEEEKKSWKRSLILEWKMIIDVDEYNSMVEEINDLKEKNKELEEYKRMYEWLG